MKYYVSYSNFVSSGTQRSAFGAQKTNEKPNPVSDVSNVHSDPANQPPLGDNDRRGWPVDIDF